ncbi:transposase [Bradyrhizobium australafricanum]|uniref:transposase n=1 Tax=Bradyrhizobium australafricanum TaxID=2821406 RepID=UPI001CE34CDB|nr:transposase [Bradyrhizobium australafricanum]
MDASPAQTAALHPKSLHSQLRYKRLEQGKFVWPPIVAGRLQLTPAQLALLVEGIDWRRTVAPEPVIRPEAV